MQRIGKILLDTDALPENILCLTYTDAGVVAMRKRLQQPDTVPGSGVAPQAELVEDMDGDLSNLIDDGNILDYNF